MHTVAQPTAHSICVAPFWAQSGLCIPILQSVSKMLAIRVHKSIRLHLIKNTARLAQLGKTSSQQTR